jgi:hypothetical protein
LAHELSLDQRWGIIKALQGIVLDQNSNQPNSNSPATQSVIEDRTEITEPVQSYNWQASEYIFHEKPAAWYLVFWLLVAVTCGVLGFFQQWLSIAVVAAMSIAVLVYSRKPPRTLSYTIDNDGISIDGRVHSYDQFRSYSVLEEIGWHEIDLEPTRRFVPRLTLLCESDDVPVIEEALSQNLPRVDRDPDWIERATRYLRF